LWFIACREPHGSFSLRNLYCPGTAPETAAPRGGEDRPSRGLHRDGPDLWNLLPPDREKRFIVPTQAVSLLPPGRIPRGMNGDEIAIHDPVRAEALVSVPPRCLSIAWDPEKLHREGETFGG